MGCFDLEDLSNPEFVLEKFEEMEWIRRLLLELTPRQEKVLRMLYGIGEDFDYRQIEVADEFNVGSTRIQEIHRKALRNLRKIVRRPIKNSLLRPRYIYNREDLWGAKIL